MYFQFFLSFHHPQSKELGPKSCINHFCHLCPSSSQNLIFGNKIEEGNYGVREPVSKGKLDPWNLGQSQ